MSYKYRGGGGGPPSPGGGGEFYLLVMKKKKKSVFFFIKKYFTKKGGEESSLKKNFFLGGGPTQGGGTHSGTPRGGVFPIWGRKEKNRRKYFWGGFLFFFLEKKVFFFAPRGPHQFLTRGFFGGGFPPQNKRKNFFAPQKGGFGNFVRAKGFFPRPGLGAPKPGGSPVKINGSRQVGLFRARELKTRFPGCPGFSKPGTRDARRSFRGTARCTGCGSRCSRSVAWWSAFRRPTASSCCCAGTIATPTMARAHRASTIASSSRPTISRSRGCGSIRTAATRCSPRATYRRRPPSATPRC